MDTYTAYLNVEPTAELNPYLWDLWLEDQLHGYPYAKYYLDRGQSPTTPPTLDWDRMPNYLMASIRNDGDEPIDVRIAVQIDGGAYIYGSTHSLGPGNDESSRLTIPASALTSGTHRICFVTQAKKSGTATWNEYYDNCNDYIIPAPLAPFGDITKVEADGVTLPEGGTVGWRVNDPCAIKIFFRNTGNLPSTFHIKVTDEDGATLCNVETASAIPADGVVRSVGCGTFRPDVIEMKTLTAHIAP